jgi:hypothetical protein
MLSEYIDGTVSAKEKADIEAHLKTCRQCSDALDELRKTVEHIKTLEEVEPPAWMTQKTMAKVRAEAEEKKSLLQRLFYPLSVKLPIQAVAVLFLAVTAFYIYQSIQPTPKRFEAPIQEFAAEKEAPPSVTARKEQIITKDSSLRSKEVPQSPGYKSLDMRLEYEKPAPPVPKDKAASTPAPAEPAEQPAQAKKEAALEKYAATPQAAAPATMQEQVAPSSGLPGKEETEAAAPAPMMRAKTKAAADTNAGKIFLTLNVQDISVAAQEVEKILIQLDGKIIKKEVVTNANAITGTIDSTRLQKFFEKLTNIGELKEKDVNSKHYEGTVALEVLVIKTLPTSK